MPEICDYENSPWRTVFWHGRDYEDRADRIALSHMLPMRGGRVCEIGAGFGRLADYYHGYERVILLDYSRTMLKDAVARLGNHPRFVFRRCRSIQLAAGGFRARYGAHRSCFASYQ